ncbi:hypothetical protein HK096_005914, partial [Nowakowskiella sp. JEL0078]
MLKSDYFSFNSTPEPATSVSLVSLPMEFDQPTLPTAIDGYSLNNDAQNLNISHNNGHFCHSQLFTVYKPNDLSQHSVNLSIENDIRKSVLTQVSDTSSCTKLSHLSEQLRDLNSTLVHSELIPKVNTKSTLQINTRNLNPENSHLSSKRPSASNLNSKFCPNNHLLANIQSSPKTPSLISPGDLTPVSTISDISLSPLHNPNQFLLPQPNQLSGPLTRNLTRSFSEQQQPAKQIPSIQTFSPEINHVIMDESSSLPPPSVGLPLHRYQLKAEFLRCYVIEDLLGEGGFGSVYSGVRRFDGKEVAVKFIYKHKIAPNLLIQDDFAVVPMEVYVLRR